MAQKLTTDFITTSIPGAYINQVVKSTTVGLSSTGIVALVGEAAGGESYANEDIKNNFFTADQFDRVEAKYRSGPIVEAMRAISAPSGDADIAGSPTRIYIIKTNAGSKASALVDTDYGTLSDANYGVDGNKIKFQIVASQAEDTPEKTGTAVPAFGAALDGASFSIRVNGGAAQVITLSANPVDHSDLATLLVELNSLLPSGISAYGGVAANTVKLKIDADSGNYRKGWGKTFELVDSTPGDLALMGLSAGLSKSAAESEIELSVVRSDIGLNQTVAAAGDVALEIGYQGTTATLTISATAITTSVTGGSGANLSIDLSQYQTVSDLVDFINSQTGYKALATTAGVQLKPSDLDKVTAIGICSTSSTVRPGRVKKSLANFKKAVSNIPAVSFAASETEGLPSPSSAAFLSGGAKGGTSSSDILDGLAKLESVQVNFVVPLISRDASDDIAEGLTDSSSAYTVDAVHAAVKSHVIKMSSAKLKRNRLGVLSFWGSFVDTQSKAQALAHYRCSLSFQKVQASSANGTDTFLPWMGAVIAAGMQAAGFYKGITNKFANLISFVDPTGFDSGNPGDIETALESGLLILQKDTSGSKWVSDQTTYGFDNNFVYNSIQATYLSDIAALNLADACQKAFVGKSLADVNRAVVESFVATQMDAYKQIKVITSSDDAPLGYKNLKVSIAGGIIYISLEVKISTTVYFIPINFTISQVQQSA